MITLYGFGNVHAQVHGETRDLRAQWVLEEVGLEYCVKALDHTAGEFDESAFDRVSCFHLVPVIDDDGFIVAESASILLYLAEKSGKLIPNDFEGRTRVVEWCFAALNTVERPLSKILLIDKFGGGEKAAERRAEMVKAANRWFAALERRLDGREWIACAEFTVADILLATVLREVRHTDLLDGYPHLKAYYARAFDRPAWQRTLALYAKRVGAVVADIA